MYAYDRLHDHWEHGRNEDQINGRGISDPKPENGNRNPGYRGDGPKNLKDGIECSIGSTHPPHPQSKWNRYADGQSEPNTDTQQRCADVPPQAPVSDQFQRSSHDGPRGGENRTSAHSDRGPPERNRCAAATQSMSTAKSPIWTGSCFCATTSPICSARRWKDIRSRGIFCGACSTTSSGRTATLTVSVSTMWTTPGKSARLN